jgi:hypothetical protein
MPRIKAHRNFIQSSIWMAVEIAFGEMADFDQKK